jgi:biopolymer transport protein ExbD
MEFRDKRHRQTHLEVGALSDILFFLLIFFLITSTLANPNVIKLTRPKSTFVGASKATAVVSVDDKGNLYVNRTPATMDNLQELLGKELSGKEEPTVLLNVAKETTADQIVQIMDIVSNKLKAKVSLATDKAK